MFERRVREQEEKRKIKKMMTERGERNSNRLEDNKDGKSGYTWLA